LFRPSALAEHLWQLLRLQLESLRLPAPVTAVRVEVLASAPLAWQQQSLFETDHRQDTARQMALLIDRLSNRLGRQAVVRSVPVSDAQPEYAAVGVPLAGSSEARETTREVKARKHTISNRRARAASAPREDERPLLLKPQPLALQVSEATGGAPRRFRIAGRDCQVARAWGPERIETGWWRTGLIRRDYYRVETTTGSHYWIFRDLRSRRWFLHGEFA
jgi:protein ImuB